MPAIKYKKKTYAGATFPVLEMTKAEYNALPESKKMDGTVYMITDGTGGWEAENSSYDNTTSGLSATNVQAALDEVADRSFAKMTRLGTGDNLNNLNKKSRSGVYYITTGVTNSPANYSVLFNLCREDNGYTGQMVFTHLGIWTRLYSGNPIAWESWRHVSLTT